MAKVAAAVIHTRYNMIIIAYKEKESFKSILNVICAYHLHISASLLFLFCVYAVVVIVVVVVVIRFGFSFLLSPSQTLRFSISLSLSASHPLFPFPFISPTISNQKLQQQTLFYCSK